MVGATLEENLAASFQVKHSFPMYVCIHTQLCLTLCDTMDYSPPGSSVHGILQARTREWGAIPFPSPGDLPNSRIEPRSPALQAESLPPELPGNPYEQSY